MKTKVKLKKIEKKLKSFITASVSRAGKKGVVLGLSGGLDSSVCLCLAAGALGGEQCHALYMPHRGSGEIREEVKLLCSNLEANLKVYDLTPLTQKFADMTDAAGPLRRGNFAARLRTAFLYQHAASQQLLVLNTSNRSEIMTGYFTKWGDEAGDISPLGNYYKSEIAELARFLLLPEKILETPPSADFFEGQRDEEELGISYLELDRVLEAISRGDESIADPQTLTKVKGLIKKSAHKRNSPLRASRVD